jgi:hypothetical protein
VVKNTTEVKQLSTVADLPFEDVLTFIFLSRILACADVDGSPGGRHNIIANPAAALPLTADSACSYSWDPDVATRHA